MENGLINNILKQVKQNKKYCSIADEILINEIKNFLNKNHIKKITKQDIKEIKKSLHISYASFQTKKKNKISSYLDELKSKVENGEDIQDITEKLLSITISTKERINDYENIYREIFKITGKPKAIIDLGSGFNPFSYPLMNLKELTYYAYDINEEDIHYLNEYFDIMSQSGLIGKVAILDLKNLTKISSMLHADIIFLFKVIDILDKNSHKPSEGLIKILIKKSKFIIVSFATKTFTRKQMNFPNRIWFELMLERNGLNFQTIKTDNEIFYIVNKI